MDRMDYEQFVTLVQQDLGIGRERDLAEELSDDLAPWVATSTDAEGFHVEEFIRWVAEGVDVPTAERHARAVFAVVGQAVRRRQLDDLVAQLTKDYGALLPTGPRMETLAPAAS